MARPKSEKTLEKERQKQEAKIAADPEVVALDAEARRTRLKTLIVLGKERGYLTYAEINDHLPDDISETDQIDSIIGMINDMGIQVYEEAPDAEALLMSDAPPPVADDDAVEEAEQALATVDSEFGRTTDPVRMYMREMGTVDLLTREGEIEIAKRIEDGLKHMVQAIAACPTTIADLLALVDKVENNEISVDELVDGLIDSDIGLEDALAVEDNEAEEEHDDEDDEGDDDDGAKAAAISAEALAKLREEVLSRFAVIRKANTEMNKIRDEKGSQDPAYKKLHLTVLEELTAFRFSAKQVEALCDQVRTMVEEVRGHERKVMDFCVNRSGMPRQHFIKSFPGNEINMDWLEAELALNKDYTEHLALFKHSILDQQDRMLTLQNRVGIPIKELREINKQMTTGEARARRAKR
ncbi:MAG: RNA polymerase sigma factor region1.1 domain-containing protein, partial [Methylophilus sp.]